jgi:two-component system LytT family response regulator
MKKISVLIVDDEPLARERVRSLVEPEPEFEILAACASGPDALAVLAERRADVVVLDIHMPEMDGFQFLAQLTPPVPVVIFLTAYDEHAVQAFEAQALDYVLKPFKPARFRAALMRAREQVLTRAPGDDATRRLLALLESRPAPTEHLTRVAVRDRQRLRFVKTAEIDWIEASGNYVILHAGKENHVMRETLATFEQQLSPREFVRVSRSAIVNLDRVQHIEPAFNNEHLIVLRDGTKLTMTRGLRELQERLKFS